MSTDDRPKQHFPYLGTAVVVSVIAVAGGYGYSVHHAYEREQEAITAIESASGHVGVKHGGSKWLREMAGDKYMKYFDRVQSVVLTSRSFDANVADSLADFARLKELDLDNTPVTDAGLASLGRLTNLRILHLDRTAVTCEGLTSLRGLPDIEELYLMQTNVTDLGLEHLAQLPKLKLLYLDNTQVSDVGLERLETARTLRWLSLGNTQVTKAGVTRLQNKLPDCAIAF